MWHVWAPRKWTQSYSSFITTGKTYQGIRYTNSENIQLKGPLRKHNSKIEDNLAEASSLTIQSPTNKKLSIHQLGDTTWIYISSIALKNSLKHSQINQSHDNSLTADDLKQIITFTTRRLAGGDVENLSRDPDRSLNSQMLVLGSLHQIRTNYQKNTINISLVNFRKLILLRHSGATCSITCDNNTLV